VTNPGTGSWDETSRIIKWNVTSDLGQGDEANFNFSMNCTQTGSLILVARGESDQIAEKSYSNDTNYGCSGVSCYINQTHTFQNPNELYERLSKLNFLIEYNWTGDNITIGESMINLTGDTDYVIPTWQNFSFGSAYDEIWANRTLAVEEETEFENTQHEIEIYSYVDATYNEFGNVTVKKIVYTWKYGKNFLEPENLFIKVKPVHPPLLENETVFPNSAGWGEGHNFSVNVYDKGDNVTVYLWEAFNVSGPWSSKGFQVYSNVGSWETLNFTVYHNCSGKGTKYYKFNATDEFGYENETSPHSFVIDEDDLIVTEIQGNNSIANRTGNQIDTLILYLQDENGTTLSNINITFYVTTSGFDWDDGVNRTTNASGYATYDFDPNCSSPMYDVGAHQWKGEITGLNCYNDKVSDLYDLTVMGNLNVTLLDPTEQNYTEGDTITFYGYLLSDCNELLYNFPVNFIPEHDSYNETLDAEVLPGGYYRYYWDTSGKLGGWYNITMRAEEAVGNTYYSDEKTYIYPNVTSPLHAFYLEVKPRLKEANVTPRQDGWAHLRNFTVNVSDEEVDNVTVEAWQRVSGDPVWTKIDGDRECQNCSNTTLEWNLSFTCSDLGGSTQQTRNFKFNATDNDGNTYETTVIAGDYVDNDRDFIIDKDDTEIHYYSGNESGVNRSGSDYAEFVLEVNDTDRNQLAYSPSINVTFNITTNGTGSTQKNDGFNLSNSSGHVHYWFDPGCNYEVGKQEWKGFTGDDDCYKVNYSGIYNVTIYGSFLVDPEPHNASGTYYQNDLVIIYINITDDCYTPLSSVTVNVTLRYNASVNYTCGNVVEENPGNYSCEWQSTTSDPSGYYDVITTVSLPELFNNGTFTEDNVFRLLSYENNNPQLTNENVTPEGWGAQTNFSLDVYDPDFANNVTVELWESPTGSDPWKLVGSDICYSCDPGETMNFSVYHTCAEANTTMYYKFNASDGAGGTASTDPHNFTIQKDDVTIYIRQGNPTEVNRSGSQTAYPTMIIRIYDDDNQTWINGSENPTNGYNNIRRPDKQRDQCFLPRRILRGF